MQRSSISTRRANPALAGLVLLQGNSGGGDGIQVVGDIIKDSNPSTGVAQAYSDHPLMTGSRSAYGSVLLEGTFYSLVIENTTLNHNGDGGMFHP